MIKVLIIEDEIPARNKLKRFLDEVQNEVHLIGEMDTVSAALDVLKNTPIDLIISDIELKDGNAFEIFDKVKITCPIIFTTAYDQFWMNAFETNGIDYLLKPFSKERFIKAWDKFLRLRNSLEYKTSQLDQLTKLIAQFTATKTYKTKYIIHLHQEMYILNVQDIVYFKANEGIVFAFDRSGKRHVVNETTLKEIEEQLNPYEFFRLNRSDLISKHHIEKIERNTKNTISLKMKGYSDYLTTSQNNTASFRIWLEN
jgi:DNA-binding LytR/AlgR family response regulator